MYGLFLKIINVPTNPLYKTKKRVGCILCPMSPVHQKKQDLLEYPYVRKKWIDAIKIMINNHYREVLRQQYSEISDDDFAECVFDAWIENIPLKQLLSGRFLQFKLDL